MENPFISDIMGYMTNKEKQTTQYEFVYQNTSIHTAIIEADSQEEAENIFWAEIDINGREHTFNKGHRVESDGPSIIAIDKL